jgi:hypothetical protein
VNNPGPQPPSGIPKIYTLAEAAEKLGMTERYLTDQLCSRRCAAMKRGRHWAMTEPQILAAIDAMSTEVRPPPDPPNPLGITPASLRRRQGGQR